MSDQVYHVTEIVGSSPSGVDDAIRTASQRSANTLRNLGWFETTQMRGDLEDGEIKHLQLHRPCARAAPAATGGQDQRRAADSVHPLVDVA